MKKKIIFLFSVIISLICISNVYAETIICDYVKYKLEYNTSKYVEIVDETTPYKYLNVYDKDGNEVIYTFYPEGEPDRAYDIYIGDSLFRVKPSHQLECAKIMYYQPKGGSVLKLKLASPADNSTDVGDVGNQSSTSHNKVTCGNITEIPKKVPELTSYAFALVQVVTPIILVIMGSIDLFKGITAQKEDEIKKVNNYLLRD